jgi:hypothetical protein
VIRIAPIFMGVQSIEAWTNKKAGRTKERPGLEK